MQWLPISVPSTDTVAAMQQNLGVSTTVAQLLVQRGYDSFEKAKAFFRPQLSMLHDPFLMKDMDRAVERILHAIATQEQIVVYGDYDVDGTTAVALLFSYLKTKTPHVHFYIPDRYTEGYGISRLGIEVASQNNAGLIIALDCGIKALEQVNFAKRLGIDFIICDHHLPGDKLPEAVAVLDPKRSDCHYPYDALCGCGIGFKLIQALHIKQKGNPKELENYLDLVATAIAADIVPITGENRVLTHFGIAQMQIKPRLGFAPFLKQLNGTITVADLVFKIAPRINAAGRMKHGKYAVELLIANTSQEALQWAQQIDAYNEDRKALDDQITQEALTQIKTLQEENTATTVVWSDHWHKGVIGIVASRLIETYYKPTVVLSKNGNTFTGSVRSVKGFDVYAALEACSAFLDQFGGHQFAAGLTLDASQLAAFKNAFEHAVQQRIDPASKIPSMTYDRILGLDDIDLKLYRIIEQMAPFGPHNMRPVFRTQFCSDTGQSRRVGQDQLHLKLVCTDPSGVVQSGIAFGMGHHYDSLKKGTPFEILYSLDLNTFNGFKELQLKIKDLKFME